MAWVDANQRTLGFVSRDVENQIAYARRLLEEARALEAIADRVGDDSTKAELSRSVAALFDLADKLANNAADTTAAGVTASTSVSSGALHLYRGER
jgi:predicted metal-dependent hydrolase